MRTARGPSTIGMAMAWPPLLAALLVVVMAGCGGSGGGVSDGSSTGIPDVSPLGNSDASPDAVPEDVPASVAPWVSSTSPTNWATGVAINATVAATFSKAIDPSTITATTFVVTGPGAVPVAATPACLDRYATLTPSSDLAPNTKFTAKITTGVKDVDGNALPSLFVWHFTTGAKRDTTSPRVTSVKPAIGATGVSSDCRVTATFSEAVDPTTITRTTFVLMEGTTRVPGSITNITYGVSSTLTFRPRDGLAPDATFTATIGTGVKDLAGNALARSFEWSFATGPPSDTTAPTVTSTSPANGATGVSVRPRITATFSEPMAPRRMTTAQFALKSGATRVLGTVTYAGRTATFTPLRALAPCTTYTAWISEGAWDLAGNALAQPFVWRFTTGLEPVSLQSAAPFAVLAGSTVTNTALVTTVNGDLGVSPGTAVVGFPPGIVNGTIHAGDPVAAQANLDLTAAYLDAEGRSCNPVTVAGNLGGQTLYPGLYKSTSSLEISSGNLTLDAQGDTNAVFIFQMASTLTTTSGRQVILSGGANADNIYWQVGSSATLGTTSVFKGNILALASITVNTGATVDGRVLAQTGAVTLDGNTINRP